MDYLIGHLIGDYLLQNDWQALNKKANTTKGWLACLVHCILYTVVVCACTGWWKPHLIFLVFLSHFPIDKTYIVAWFMIKSGSFRRIIGDMRLWYHCPTCGVYEKKDPSSPQYIRWDGKCTRTFPRPNLGENIAVGCSGQMEKDDWRNTTDMNHKVWAYLIVDNTVHIVLLWAIARFAV